MGLIVHHGAGHAGVTALADDLAARLATPPIDPFAPDVVAVPTAGVRDWLSRHLAERLGIAANISMPFPNRFVASALGLPDVGSDPWDVEQLTWFVLAELDAGTVDVPGWRQAAPVGTAMSRRFAIARRIADLFYRYSANRPQVIQHWANGAVGDGTVRSDGSIAELVGPLGDDFVWQFKLWRAVRERIGAPCPAEQLPALLAELAEGQREVDLPERVSWFGMSGLSAARLDVLRALAATRDVHAYLLHPSPQAWNRTTALVTDRLMLRRRGDGAAATGHPLVASWGRPAGELAALARGHAAADPDQVTLEDAPPDTVEPRTLLEQVQADIRADTAPQAAPGLHADSSLQVHACHGVTRQLEVLRDVLGHLFVADPAITPSDVLVLCPDPDRFRPFAAAVFARGALPVPLAVTDVSLGTENAVAATLAEVLRVVTGRCTAADVLGIAGLEPVRRRLGLSMDDVDQISAWIGQLGTSWGLDGEHRERWLGDTLESGTWDATIASLLMGAAVPAATPMVGPGGVVPHDDMSADTTRTAGRLAELVARLRHVRGLLEEPRPMTEWCDVLVDVLALLCAAGRSEAWQIPAVTTAITELRDAADAASGVLLGAADVRAVVDELVAAPRGRLRLRSGKVTLTGMVPVRDVPAKVICLLGFDEASMRLPGIDGDDLLAVRPCVGEPDRRAERRQLVLDAVLAAERHLVIMCDGSDITTNRRVRLGVQLTELLDVVDATLGVDVHGDADSPVITRHPLRGYDDDNFNGKISSPGTSGPLGFDAAMRDAAEIRRDADDQAPPVLVDRWSLGHTEPVEAAAETPVTFEQLTDACARPARTLLRDGLDIRLPGEATELDPLIPLAVSPLDSASLGRRLAEQLIEAGRGHVSAADWGELAQSVRERWGAAEALSGRMPPRELARQSLQSVANELDAVAAAAARAGLGPEEWFGADGTLAVDLSLAYRLRLVDTIDGIVEHDDLSTITHLAYSRPKQRVVLAAALKLAAAVAHTRTGEWRAVTITRAAKRSEHPQCHLLVPVGRDPLTTAASLLDVAASLRVEALRKAIPLFEESSRRLHESRLLDEDHYFGTDFVRGDLGDAETGFVWDNIPLTDVLAMQPSPTDYADRLWGAVCAFARPDLLKAPRAKKQQAAR